MIKNIFTQKSLSKYFPLIVIIFLLIFAQYLYSNFKVLLKPVGGDYEDFYLSGKAVISGKNPYVSLGGNGSVMRNPPPALLLFSFLSLFPPQFSQFIFFFTSLGASYLGLRLLLKVIYQETHSKMIKENFWPLNLLLISAILVFFPFRFALVSGHINGYLFLILSAAIYYFFQKKDFFVGILISIGASLIITPIFFGFLFLIQKKFQAIWGLIMGLVVLSSFTIILLGFKVFPQYLAATNSYLDFAGSHYYNQNLVAAFSRFSFGPEITRDLLLVLIVIVLFLIFNWYKKAAKSPWADLIFWNNGILFTLLLVTSTWQYYFIIAIIPLIITLFAIPALKLSRTFYLSVFLAYLLMGLNIKNPQTFAHQGPIGMIILSHVFWGGLLLLIVNLYLLYLLTKSSFVNLGGGLR